MIRLHIDPAFADLLQLHDLGTYTGIMRTTAGELVEENE
jgi:hypothetical protein